MARPHEISTAKAPAAIGPYSQAIACGGLLFVSGQLGISPESGELVSTNVTDQAEQALHNLRNVLDAAGAGMNSVIKTTVYLMDMGDFPAVNAIYARYFHEPFPARACVAVAALPRQALVEIDAVACLSTAG